eukprot:CAMPEP_0177650608 /NCGR_PEP_ID=MMETSP0447-20121125/12041_1 /TAXON_ID=0 /ORGANISM="Stygamoeba regulata, Strain BSH-02190019" /LENGTH=516 /DNA_ID=CAMNT_0019153505 /DNA_START=66 /DNA_END=1616 /DNA_ORIENTATION=-
MSAAQIGDRDEFVVDPNLVTLLISSLVLLITRWLWNMIPAPSQARNSPPRVSGWMPYFGVWWDLKADPEHYLRRCYEQHGEVFTLYMCGRNYHMLWNHEDHHIFYLKPDEEVSGASQPFVAVLGSKDAALFSSENRNEINATVAQWLGFFHRHVARGLSGQYMRSYTSGIHDEIRRGIAELPPSGELDLYQFLIDMSLRCTLRLMLGEGFLAEHPELHADVMTVKHYFDNYAPDPFLKSFVLLVPTPQNFAIRKAIIRIKSTFHNRIEELYEKGEGEETLLFSALKVSRANDVTFGPSHGITLVMFLLTLSATANMPVVSFWALYHLNRNKKACADVIQDYRRVANAARAEGRSLFNRHDYHELKVMDNTVKESVRMHQGVIHLGNVLRAIHKDQEVGGYVLEKGSILCLPTHQYFDERWYKHPHEFDPDRWNDSQWVESLPRFTFTPFGAGAHFCPGRLVASCFIKIITSEFLETFNFEFVNEVTKSTPPFTGVAPPTCGQGRNVIRFTRKPSAQ